MPSEMIWSTRQTHVPVPRASAVSAALSWPARSPLHEHPDSLPGISEIEGAGHISQKGEADRQS